MKDLLNNIKSFLITFSEKSATNLNELREQFLGYFFMLILVVSVLLLPRQIITHDTIAQAIIYFGILTSITGLLLSRRGKFMYARILLSLLVYTAYGGLFYFNQVAFYYFVIGTTLYSIVASFINRNFWMTCIEYIFVLAWITATLYQYSEQWIDISVTIFAFFIFFFLVSILINSLETRLNAVISKSQKLNEHLKKKNEEIQMYINIIAHDIKAPLRSIKGFSKHIDKKITSYEIEDEDIKSSFAYIYQSTDLLNKLIDDLLTKAKIDKQKLKIEKIDFEELIELQLFKLKYQIEQSHTQIELISLDSIVGDYRCMIILFHNLISNAIKYMPKDNQHKPKISISQQANKECDLITISDNGIGIEEEFLSKIFQPFRRLHTSSEYEGTGLGLSICKSIVENHNGDLSVNSTVGKGSNFCIKLPKITHP